MSQIKPINHRDYLALVSSAPLRILSSSVLGGGLGYCRSLLNLRVDKDAPPPWPPAEETLSRYAEQLNLPAPVAGMMTAASMQSLSTAHALIRTDRGELSVHCWVTCGLSNLLRAGDPTGEAPRAGTINIVLFINQPLTDTALTEALIMLTEAKVTAIRDAALISPVSGLPASGTGTDSHAVLCADNRNGGTPFCGKHTELGQLIGQTVLQACTDSINKCIRAISAASD